MERCSVSLLVAIIYTSDGCLTKYFVYLSGEYINVARVEVNTLAQLLEISEGIHWGSDGYY